MNYLQQYYRIVEETTPEKLPNISTDQLEKYYLQFADFRANLSDNNLKDTSVHRMALLRGEIQSRRAEVHSQGQHCVVVDQGKKILFWAKVGGIAAVIGTLVLLVSDTGLSNFLRARAFQASPASSPTATATVEPSPTPTAVESPSPAPPASPTAPAASTPTTTPIKFPPPAP